jgi:hypothetical protein
MEDATRLLTSDEYARWISNGWGYRTLDSEIVLCAICACRAIDRVGADMVLGSCRVELNRIKSESWRLGS